MAVHLPSVRGVRSCPYLGLSGRCWAAYSAERPICGFLASPELHGSCAVYRLAASEPRRRRTRGTRRKASSATRPVRRPN
jgi:hypothetical protein